MKVAFGARLVFNLPKSDGKRKCNKQTNFCLMRLCQFMRRFKKRSNRVRAVVFQRFLLPAICLVLLIFTGVAEARTTRVSDVRFGEQGNATRVVIDADAPLTYKYFTLPNGSPRIIVEMPRVRWSIDGLTAEAGRGEGKGLVEQFRFEHNSPTSSRLILDLSSPARVSKDEVLKPGRTETAHRIVFDLEKVAEAEFRTAPSPVPVASERKPRSVDREKRRKPLIVIDAGHGGKDPGAIGAHGHYEKDVTLSAAKALKQALLRTGRYEVAMTRDDDTFIELEERVRRAREFHADLFISLHADAGRKSETRGASVYTLSASGERRSQQLRHTHDWVLDVERDSNRPAEVNAILASLLERETKNQSARFARMLIPEIERMGWPTLDNTHRNAGFFVLLAPDVPAVLVEMGFMTNSKDEALMTNQRHRRKLIRAIVKATDTFFEDKELYVASR